jgi:hypothetical protein
MDSYTITIAPNDDSGAATRLVVDTSGDQVRITDVHLHAPQGLSSGHIPTVDFRSAPASGHRHRDRVDRSAGRRRRRAERSEWDPRPGGSCR